MPNALADLTDEQLEQHRLDVLTEIEKRQRRTQIPEQVSQLAATYVADGGDPADLVAAIPSSA